jgi:hypothetical protein
VIVNACGVAGAGGACGAGDGVSDGLDGEQAKAATGRRTASERTPNPSVVMSIKT